MFDTNCANDRQGRQFASLTVIRVHPWLKKKLCGSLRPRRLCVEDVSFGSVRLRESRTTTRTIEYRSQSALLPCLFCASLGTLWTWKHRLCRPQRAAAAVDTAADHHAAAAGQTAQEPGLDDFCDHSARVAGIQPVGEFHPIYFTRVQLRIQPGRLSHQPGARSRPAARGMRARRQRLAQQNRRGHGGRHHHRPHDGSGGQQHGGRHQGAA